VIANLSPAKNAVSLFSQPMTQKNGNLLQIPKSIQLTNQTLKQTYTELAAVKGIQLLQCSSINTTEKINK